MFKLFAGTSHPKLASELSKKLGIPLAKAEIIRFENSEVRVTLQEDVKDQTCVVLQTTSNPTDEHLMELFLFADALKRSEAKKIIAIIPSFGYARQNVQHRPGECVSIHVVIQFLETVGFKEVYVFDLHEEASQGIFSIPFKNLSAFPDMAKAVQNYLQGDAEVEKITIISPDQEGIERARSFGEAMFGNDAFSSATVNKKRDTEHMHKSEALALYGDVKGKIAILVDDICTSGGTLIHAADLCIKNGAKRVVAVITHHDFGNNVAPYLQQSIIEQFFFSNSIPLKEDQSFPKLSEVSLASTIAEELKKI